MTERDREEARDLLADLLQIYREDADPKAVRRELADLPDKIAAPLERARRENEECEAWRQVAVEANRALDAYLREQMPNLEEHYGMPVDGVRRVVEHVRAECLKVDAQTMREELERAREGWSAVREAVREDVQQVADGQLTLVRLDERCKMVEEIEADLKAAEMVDEYDTGDRMVEQWNSALREAARIVRRIGGLDESDSTDNV